MQVVMNLKIIYAEYTMHQMNRHLKLQIFENDCEANDDKLRLEYKPNRY